MNPPAGHITVDASLFFEGSRWRIKNQFPVFRLLPSSEEKKRRAKKGGNKKTFWFVLAPSRVRHSLPYTFPPGDFPRFAGPFTLARPGRTDGEKEEKRNREKVWRVAAAGASKGEKEKTFSPGSGSSLVAASLPPCSSVPRTGVALRTALLTVFCVQMWERRRGLLLLLLLSEREEGGRSRRGSRVSFLSLSLGGCSLPDGECFFFSKASDRGACNYFSSFSILSAR